MHTANRRSERISATYLVETPLPVRDAAEALAGEQSSGTFVKVPGETAALRKRFAARVEKITELDTRRRPSLPGCRPAGRKFRRAKIVLSWSVENIGCNLPTLISTVQGNLYELAQFSGLRLMDLDLPDSFGQQFNGPGFGISGTRHLTGVRQRPLIGTIIKPSIGLTPQQTAAIVKQLAFAGIDFVKDDELMADPPHSPFEGRVSAVMQVINDHSQKTGKKVMYAFNISGELDRMLRNYELIVRAGGTAAMLSLNSVGLAGVKRVCDEGELAIHGHRNGWGMLTRHPLLGIDFAAYQKLWRLAGVDQLHVNGIENKFWEDDDSVARSIAACLKPMPGLLPILPVVSSGQWGGQAPETYRRTRTLDLLYLAGGGIMAHPDGPAGGVKALRQAWEAAVAGVPLEKAARTHAELRHSIEKFGGSHRRTKNEIRRM
jgi:ribulose-bisphosphate carboxylase large chain